MDISCTKENLYQGLNIVSHLMNKQVHLPILQNILIKAEGGSIRCSATNLEMAIHCSIRGKVDEGGEITIPAKLFFDYIHLLPNETIHIQSKEDHQVLVESESSKTVIHGMSATEFPLIPSFEGEKIIQLPAEDIRSTLTQLLFSVATNESRPELTGVFFSFLPSPNESRLIAASTDTYQLSERTLPIIQSVEEAFQVVIPSKTLQEVNRILSLFSDDVEIPSTLSFSFSQNQIMMHYGSVELISRTIEEKFPDYVHFLPKEFRTTAFVDREDFYTAIKTASLFAKTHLHDVTVVLEPETQQLVIQASDSVRGSHESRLSATIQGEKNNVTLNYRYLLEGLQAIRSDRIRFGMIDSFNPCLITPEKTSELYQYLVMPIKQQGDLS